MDPNAAKAQVRILARYAQEEKSVKMSSKPCGELKDEIDLRDHISVTILSPQMRQHSAKVKNIRRVVWPDFHLRETMRGLSL